MTWRPVAGATFSILSGNTEHLHVVLGDPRDIHGRPKQSVASVCFCTVRGRYDDTTCIVQGGCHSFIKHASYVYYKMARFDRAAQLIELYEQETIRVFDPLEAKCFKAVRDGVIQSAFAPRDLALFL